MKSSSESSAHCMSSNDMTTGYVVGQPLEEQPPGREEVVALVADALLEAEQVREPRLDEAAVRLVGERLRDDLLQLGARRAGSSSSAMRARMRTMSASAQYVTPSP